MVWLVALLLQQPVADLRPLADRVLVADIGRGEARLRPDGSIETRIELAVVAIEKGPPGPAILRLPGGCVGRVCERYSDTPRLVRGRYRLYLRGAHLLGGARGAERLGDGPGGALAPAFELNGASWAHHERPVEEPFHLNPSSFDLPPAELRRIFRAGLWVWTSEGRADVRLLEGPDTGTTQFGGLDDDLNTTFFEATDEGVALALARHRSVDGEMRDCDIRVYGRNAAGPIVWSTDPGGAAPGRYDLQQTITHELGHCLGLAHTRVTEAMMSQTLPDGTGDERRHLHPDDIAGLEELYGEAARPDAGPDASAPPDMRVADVVAMPDAPGSDDAAPAVDLASVDARVAADARPDEGDSSTSASGCQLVPALWLPLLAVGRRR